MVRVPLPMAEVWAEMQAKVEELTGQAGLHILRAILENEVTRRVGPPHRPDPTAGCVRWGKQSGYVVFGGQKIPLERPRVRKREGQEVELESYGQLQQDGKMQRAVRETHGGRTVHAELSASGGERCGRLRDREKQREPAVRRSQ
jgi:putative transposase